MESCNDVDDAGAGVLVLLLLLLVIVLYRMVWYVTCYGMTIIVQLPQHL